MSYVSLNDSLYFTANFYHPTSGFSYAADATPAWYVYESGAAQILSGSMTARDGIVGSYWGTFDATVANGFVSQRHYDVQVSGAVGGVTGFSSVKEFVLDDVYDTNVVSVSGVLITSDNSTVDANVTQVNGESIDYESGIVDANILQVSGEYVDIDDFVNVDLSTIESKLDNNNLYLIAVSGDVITILADTNELQINQGNWLTATGFATPTDILSASGAIIDSIDGLNDFDPTTTAVSVSGVVDANTVQISGVPVSLSTDVVDANLVQVSGTPITLSSAVDANLTQINGEAFTFADAVSVSGVVDSNVVQVSGEYVSINDFKTDTSSLDADIYFAQIKHVQDTNNDTDEFVVHWFRNDQPVSSGELTTPTLSIYNTATGASIVQNAGMYYSSPNVGTVRYDSPIILASGEPYLVETSGTISSSVRTWRSIVGIDTL